MSAARASAATLRGGLFAPFGSSALLRLRSDEDLVAMVRRGHEAAFAVVVDRYEARLARFCRHMLGSREDAEDVLQEVLVAAYVALRADEREIAVGPWLYRIARNRALNHIRDRPRAGHVPLEFETAGEPFSEAGCSTAEKAQSREDFRLVVSDIRSLPETQRTALVLREVDGLSHAQIAEVMQTTIPGVKCLLVRARQTLAEGVEARALRCDDVRYELSHAAEGTRRASRAVRRHVRGCETCARFGDHLKLTNRATAALAPPAGLLIALKQALALPLGAKTSGAAVGGSAATAGVLSSAPLTSSFGALAAKVAAGVAIAALASAGAGEVLHSPTRHATVPSTHRAGVSAPVSAHAALARRESSVAGSVGAAVASTSRARHSAHGAVQSTAVAGVSRAHRARGAQADGAPTPAAPAVQSTTPAAATPATTTTATTPTPLTVMPSATPVKPVTQTPTTTTAATVPSTPARNWTPVTAPAPSTTSSTASGQTPSSSSSSGTTGTTPSSHPLGTALKNVGKQTVATANAVAYFNVPNAVAKVTHAATSTSLL
ncbi:MAG TPA: RNA polymerase sigma factor [Solirubrobacteraceae bacterium]|jgi:RNA polymerase sigma factor (sigma-70 family)|nr:RNA polymerase sigma factor [Solirubrobacteraceae bacterium]